MRLFWKKSNTKAEPIEVIEEVVPAKEEPFLDTFEMKLEHNLSKQMVSRVLTSLGSLSTTAFDHGIDERTVLNALQLSLEELRHNVGESTLRGLVVEARAISDDDPANY